MLNPIQNIVNYLNPFKTQVSALPENATAKGRNEPWKEDPAGFMVSIIKAQHSEYKKEISSWKAARTAALNIDRPRRKLLIELYGDIMTDAIVLSEVNKRIDRCLNKQFKITDWGTKKEISEKTDLYNKAWFYEWMRYTMESKFYGASLPYIKAVSDGLIKEIDLVPRKHVIPELNGILPDLSGDKIIDYTQPPFNQYCTPVGKPGNLGLLDAVAPLYILKKHSWGNWDQFEEMFGIPIRIAKTASTDPKVKAAITSWLRDMGSSNFGLFPQDTTLEIKENKNADAFQVFNEKRKAANEEICILINSQFETGNQTGSRAKTESVIQNTQEETTKADLRFLYFEINDKLMPIMAGIGYPINPEQDVFQWNIPEDLKEKLTVFKGVNDMGFELDPVQVEETFNVKILGKKEPAKPTGGDPDPKK